MGTGQVELVAQEIREIGARLADSLHRALVDGECDHVHAAASRTARLQHGDMNMAMRGVRDARLWPAGRQLHARQSDPCSRRRCVRRTALPHSVMTIGAESIAPITTRAVAALGIDQDGADRMGEFAGLAATLGVAPLRRCRHRRDVNGFDDLAIAQRRFECTDDEILHRHRARTRQASQRQFRAQRRQRGYPVGRGIGMAEDPPTVPRLRTAR